MMFCLVVLLKLMLGLSMILLCVILVFVVMLSECRKNVFMLVMMLMVGLVLL